MSLAANYAAADLAAALHAAREHFAPQMQQVMRDIRRILAGRDPRQLVDHECLQHFILRTRFNEPTSAQRDYAEAHLARRQQPRLSSEQADNVLTKISTSRRRIMKQPQTAAIYG